MRAPRSPVPRSEKNRRLLPPGRRPTVCACRPLLLRPLVLLSPLLRGLLLLLLLLLPKTRWAC